VWGYSQVRDLIGVTSKILILFDLWDGRPGQSGRRASAACRQEDAGGSGFRVDWVDVLAWICMMRSDRLSR
jgi:hypothetical protein